ncbi:MAG: ATP-dependent DNA helicase [Rhodospirillales bacterium]|nr:ATP-dependent DNA helicase [Rhodospirillales bacterium]
MSRDSLPEVRLPDAPALVAGAGGAAWISVAGEVEALSLDDAAARLRAGAAPLVCHARALARRLGLGSFTALDLLELFAFAHPARFCLPTPHGLAAALGLPLPAGRNQEAEFLFSAARALLSSLAPSGCPAGGDAHRLAASMAGAGWGWGDAVLRTLGGGEETRQRHDLVDAFRVWNGFKEWDDRGPEPAPDNQPVEPVEARARLARLLGPDAEERPQQAEYAAEVSAAFMPRERRGEPHFVVAEAGTGVGKTLGYLAPASVWAEKNRGPVWISTYTRNLQRQLDSELDRVFPEPGAKRRQVVVRKGRENYLCLLNFDEAVGELATRLGGDAIALGLMARWAAASRDGDMVGGDFPAWLVELAGRAATLDLTDTRGECVYSACPHYRKCFIERTVRSARRASIVVANHALVMIQVTLGGGDEAAGAFVPTRYVFDEGHHLFDAADSAFSARLTGRETAELRRWILGAEGRRRSRSRGLRARIQDLVASDEAGRDALAEVIRAAHALPGAGWYGRLADEIPVGPAESFLALVRQQVYARDPDPRAPYDLECETLPPVVGLIEAGRALDAALGAIEQPMGVLVARLASLLDREADVLETAQRLRLEAVSRGLDRRGGRMIAGWRAMLRALEAEAPEPSFVDWFGVARADGRDLDVGYHRHWIDPTLPFAESLVDTAHGVLVTSASLADSTGDAEADWSAAERRTGASHLARPAVRAAVASPFDYVRQTRIFVITDVARNDAPQVAAAYRELFIAVGGGGLGLFTAIARLRAVYDRIAASLDEAGLALLVQHVDAMDTGTLIDVFRAQEDTCLLGTDAVRDGIDVPGRSLRLIVFDRVPWPRPDIVHRARRRAFGGNGYDEMLARLRLRQAYGRLVRRASDRGAFVMLDRALPSRLARAFPPGVALERVGLAEAVTSLSAFLGPR